MTTRFEMEIINEIANRAVRMASDNGITYDKMTAFMDIEFAHQDCPLHLGKLFQADDANFAHDIFGIRNNLNRDTKKIDNCFLPRFALSQHSAIGRLHTGPFTGAELSDGFTDERDEEAALQEEADSWSVK